MANALGLVNIGAAAGGGLREFLIERELQRRQLNLEDERAKRLTMEGERLRLEEARNRRADEVEARSARAQVDAAKLARDVFELGLAKTTVDTAGADDVIVPGTEQATAVERFFPNRVEQRPGIIDTAPIAEDGLIPGLNAPADVPGIMDLGAAQVHEPGAYLKPGFAYEQARTAASEREALARIAAIERARLDAERRGDAVAKAEADRELRRELAALSASTSLAVAAGNQSIRRDAADLKAEETQAAKDRAAEAAATQANDMITVIGEILTPEGKLKPEYETVVGGRRIPELASSATGIGATAIAKINRLQSMLTLDKITAMSTASRNGSSGLSPMSDSDREMLSNAQSTLGNRAQDEDAFAAELVRLRDVARKLTKSGARTAPPANETPEARAIRLRQQYERKP